MARGKKTGGGSRKGRKNKRTQGVELEVAAMHAEMKGETLSVVAMHKGVQIFQALMVDAAKKLVDAQTEKDKAKWGSELERWGSMLHKFGASVAPYQSPKLNPIDDPNRPRPADDEKEGDLGTISIALKRDGKVYGEVTNGHYRAIDGPDRADDPDEPDAVERQDFEG